MTRLKQAFWKGVINVADWLYEAAEAKMPRPRRVYDFFGDPRQTGALLQLSQPFGGEA